MTEDNLPDAARGLISRCLSSLDHVEVLLLLRAESSDACTTRQLAERTRLSDDVVTRVIDDLIRGGLVAETQRGIRFLASPADSAAIEHVAHAYHTRPVSLVRAIHSRLAPARSFSDALRPRNGETP